MGVHIPYRQLEGYLSYPTQHLFLGITHLPKISVRAEGYFFRSISCLKSIDFSCDERMPFQVVKVGGSLISCAKDLIQRLVQLQDCNFLVVPGGGPMADLIRGIFLEQELSDDAAHWMAILAMEQYAYLLADGTGASMVDQIARPKGVGVLRPYRALLEDDCDIGHRWEYTSDSIAALVACKLQADLIKVTDVDGVILDGKVADRLRAEDLLGVETCIDQGALRLLRKYGRSCRVIGGLDPERFIYSVKKGVGGTLVIG
jgi:aspartokinase-like uncharacterized kinase